MSNPSEYPVLYTEPLIPESVEELFSELETFKHIRSAHGYFLSRDPIDGVLIDVGESRENPLTVHFYTFRDSLTPIAKIYREGDRVVVELSDTRREYWYKRLLKMALLKLKETPWYNSDNAPIGFHASK